MELAPGRDRASFLLKPVGEMPPTRSGLCRGAADERPRAERRARTDVPWLSSITLPWGLELRLLNISSSGLLVETTAKLQPGTAVQLHIMSPDGEIVLPARFVRSEVADVDGRGVKYRAAAAFDRQLERLAASRASSLPAASEALVQVFAEAMSGLETRTERASSRFLRGLRTIVQARDVQLHEVSGETRGDDSLYFTVPAHDGAQALLQVTPAPNHDLRESDLRILRAATWLTAAMLELEKPSARADAALLAS